jgi:putative glutamine amidotransferase
MRLLSLGFLARISTSVCLGFTTLPLQPKALTSINLGQAKGRRMDSSILVICSDPSAARQTSQKALEEAGWKGKIVLITAQDPLPNLDDVEGILLTGGADIHPKYWDVQEPLHEKAEPDDARTDLEIKVINHAQEKNLPILGLCRGQQIINVALGGSMYQHLPDEGVPLARTYVGKYSDEKQVLPHSVSVKANSQLAHLLQIKVPRMDVNSRHHQAVKEVGKGLIISAVDQEDLVGGRPMIEGLESSDPSRFIVGVQWHPENLTREEGPTGEAARNLFKGFLDAIRDKRK